MPQESLIEFPCDFPIKIMGLNNDDIRQSVLAIAARHKGSDAQESVTERPSRNGKYMAFTMTLNYSSQEELDAMYRTLTAVDGVSMVL